MDLLYNAWLSTTHTLGKETLKNIADYMSRLLNKNAELNLLVMISKNLQHILI